VFNADELARALTLPRFRWQGRTYTGRLLGFTDAVTLEAKLNGMAAEADLADIKAVACDMLAVLRFTDDETGAALAPEALFSLPGPLLLPALRDFLAPQGDVTGPAAVEPTSPTPGSTSPGAESPGQQPRRKHNPSR
jgi:hypothetical protein